MNNYPKHRWNFCQYVPTWYWFLCHLKAYSCPKLNVHLHNQVRGRNRLSSHWEIQQKSLEITATIQQPHKEQICKEHFWDKVVFRDVSSYQQTFRLFPSSCLLQPVLPGHSEAEASLCHSIAVLSVHFCLHSQVRWRVMLRLWRFFSKFLCFEF